ncbi:Transcription factor MYC/MYB N-terminal [Macleaya cordata]|uniref:Transcription factor MYC/MYB N-terminal n=1 Tax=Macleaya cordata TaxID=56857 RepID=A0A200PZT5_MACCD|nr:Transcription factor MYC/MYB N-terminal [Macleaya cordata]
MEEQINPLTVTHLLQHTLRSLCNHEGSQWVYAVFWRILPRNFPPPKWDVQEGAYDRSRGNRRNWILVWEDGFCNFAAASMAEADSGDCTGSSAYGNCEFQPLRGLQPEVFFKMSHEIYNYGEGLIGKVASDRSHKWIYKDPSEQEINYLSAWHNTGDSQPRTWEAQFQSGIKTIALIAVREGVVQLGAVHKVMEDPSYIILLRKKFCYLESIPGVLLPHPSSSLPIPYKVDGYGASNTAWPFHAALAPPTSMEVYHNYDHFSQPMKITPSMSALQALLSKLPSVVPTPSPSSSGYCESLPQFISSQRPLELGEMPKMTKEETDDEYRREREMGESSNSISYHYQQQQHHHLNLTSSRPNKGF